MFQTIGSTKERRRGADGLVVHCDGVWRMRAMRMEEVKEKLSLWRRSLHKTGTGHVAITRKLSVKKGIWNLKRMGPI